MLDFSQQILLQNPQPLQTSDMLFYYYYYFFGKPLIGSKAGSKLNKQNKC